MRSFDRRSAIRSLLAFSALALSVDACKKSGPEALPTPGSAAAPAPASAEPSVVTLQGSGASFPAPLYSRWFREFSAKNPNIRVNYQSTGSGAGIKAFTAGQTDFGASDAAMSDEEIKAAQGNVVLLPVTAGHIVLSYTLPDVKELKLSREAYAGIFLGTISKWNDPKIAKSNPGVKLPATDITPSTARTAAAPPSSSPSISPPSARNGRAAPARASPSTGRRRRPSAERRTTASPP